MTRLLYLFAFLENGTDPNHAGKRLACERLLHDSVTQELKVMETKHFFIISSTQGLF